MQATTVTPDDFSSLSGNLDKLDSLFKQIGQDALTIVNPLSLISEGILSTTRGAEALDKNMLLARSRVIELRYAIGDALPAIDSLGGDLSKTAMAIRDIALGSRRNVIESTETIEKIYATSKVLNQNITDIVTKFSTIGIQTANIGKNVEDSVSYIRGLGLNANIIMGDVVKNMDMMNKYNFEGGVQGLTKMAAQASMLRFDMGQTFSLAEKVLDPEKAIDVAASFQRLGLAVDGLGDPMKLMYEGLMNPAGLQDSLIKMTQQFVKIDEATGRISISPDGMLKMRELEKLGIASAAELSKAAIASADLGQRMSKINLNIPKEDKEFLANIAYMDKSGEYKVKLVDEITGKQEIVDLNRVSAEQLKKLREQQENAPKTMEDIAKASLSTEETIAKYTRETKDYLSLLITNNQTVASNIEGLQRIIRIAPDKMIGAFQKDPNMKEQAGELNNAVLNSLGQLMRGNLTPTEILPAMRKMEEKISVEYNKLTEVAKVDFKKGLVDVRENVKPSTMVEYAFLEKVLNPLLTKVGLETAKLPKRPETEPESRRIREQVPQRIAEAKPQRIAEAAIQDREIKALNTENIKTEKIVTEKPDTGKIEIKYPSGSALALPSNQFFEGIRNALSLVMHYYSNSPQLRIFSVGMDSTYKDDLFKAHKEAIKPQSETLTQIQKVSENSSKEKENREKETNQTLKELSEKNNLISKISDVKNQEVNTERIGVEKIFEKMNKDTITNYVSGIIPTPRTEKNTETLKYTNPNIENYENISPTRLTTPTSIPSIIEDSQKIKDIISSYKESIINNNQTLKEEKNFFETLVNKDTTEKRNVETSKDVLNYFKELTKESTVNNKTSQTLDNFTYFKEYVTKKESQKTDNLTSLNELLTKKESQKSESISNLYEKFFEKNITNQPTSVSIKINDTPEKVSDLQKNIGKSKDTEYNLEERVSKVSPKIPQSTQIQDKIIKLEEQTVTKLVEEEKNLGEKFLQYRPQSLNTDTEIKPIKVSLQTPEPTVQSLGFEKSPVADLEKVTQTVETLSSKNLDVSGNISVNVNLTGLEPGMDKAKLEETLFKIFNGPDFGASIMAQVTRGQEKIKTPLPGYLQNQRIR